MLNSPRAAITKFSGVLKVSSNSLPTLPTIGEMFTSSDKTLTALGNIAGYAMTAGVEKDAVGDAKKIAAKMGPQDPPALAAPTAISKTPTQADASTTAIQNQLSREKNAFATSTFLTGGAGLLEPPTTTSQVLLGN